MPHPNDPVVHIKQPHDIYIGRPKANQPWNFGNPFRIGPDGDRDTVISKFESWIVNGESFSNPDATPARRQWILSNLPSLANKKLGCFCRPGKCHGDILCKLLKATPSAPSTAPTPTSAPTPPSSPISWARHGGYEVSTKGDPRFSAFNAMMPDGRSIEQHYQGDVKGYDPGGTNWRLGKGKPPLKPMTPEQLKAAYLALWAKWAEANPKLILELRDKVAQHNNLLSDRFASSGVNQAWALSEILNKISSPAPASASAPTPEPPILDKRMALRQPGEIFDVTPFLNNPRSPVEIAVPKTMSPKTDRPFTYAGIGSREVPDPVMLDIMERLGSKGAKLGHVLRSGGAIGSDQAFEKGARSVISDSMSPLLEIFFDKGFRGKGYTEDQLRLQNAYVNRFHPAPERLTPFTRRLHGRNTHQVLGLSGDDPVDLVIAYRNPAKTRSGTDQALRIAKHFNIPIVNLADRTVLPNPKDLSPLIQLLKNLKFLK